MCLTPRIAHAPELRGPITRIPEAGGQAAAGRGAQRAGRFRPGSGPPSDGAQMSQSQAFAEGPAWKLLAKFTESLCVGEMDVQASPENKGKLKRNRGRNSFYIVASHSAFRRSLRMAPLVRKMSRSSIWAQPGCRVRVADPLHSRGSPAPSVSSSSLHPEGKVIFSN